MLFCCATDTRHADEQHERRPHRADDTEPHRPETDPTSEGEQRLHEHRERQSRQREAHRRNPCSVQRRAPAQVPTHWGISGEADGRGSRLSTLLFLSVMTAVPVALPACCLLYTSDAADEEDSVD